MVDCIWHAVKVKNAVLIRLDVGHYQLVHYQTVILDIEKLTYGGYKINAFRPVSMSSSRAINQALRYLGSDLSVKEIRRIRHNEDLELTN